MKIGKIGVTPKFYETICKWSKKKQIEFIATQGDYKHLNAESLNKEADLILKNIPNGDNKESQKQPEEANKGTTGKRGRKNSTSGQKASKPKKS